MLFIQSYLALLLVSFSFALYGLAWSVGAQLELVVLAASVLTLLVVWYLERKLPYRQEWRKNHGDLKTDLMSAGVLVGVMDPLLKALAPLAVLTIYAHIGVSPVSIDLPLGYQIALTLLIVELGKYIAHRLLHHSMPLWWLHALHHGSKRLYFVNGLRLHPLNYVFTFALSVFPVMLLGASAEALFAYLAITQPIVLLQHANIDLRHGWLNYVFSTPEAHRWHHSTLPEEANRNFGNALLIWDHVFGTFKMADGFNVTKKVGLFVSSQNRYPLDASYFTQIISMFKSPCCRA